MAKLSDYSGDKVIDMVADLLDPLSEILTDKALKAAWDSKIDKLKIVQMTLRKHKEAVIRILAIINDKPVSEYKKEITLFTLPKQVLDILNDEQFHQLFTSQGQMSESPNTGSATANTEEGAN